MGYPREYVSKKEQSWCTYNFREIGYMVHLALNGQTVEGWQDREVVVNVLVLHQSDSFLARMPVQPCRDLTNCSLPIKLVWNTGGKDVDSVD